MEKVPALFSFAANGKSFQPMELQEQSCQFFWCEFYTANTSCIKLHWGQNGRAGKKREVHYLTERKHLFMWLHFCTDTWNSTYVTASHCFFQQACKNINESIYVCVCMCKTVNKIWNNFSVSLEIISTHSSPVTKEQILAEQFRSKNHIIIYRQWIGQAGFRRNCFMHMEHSHAMLLNTGISFAAKPGGRKLKYSPYILVSLSNYRWQSFCFALICNCIKYNPAMYSISQCL